MQIKNCKRPTLVSSRTSSLPISEMSVIIYGIKHTIHGRHTRHYKKHNTTTVRKIHWSEHSDSVSIHHSFQLPLSHQWCDQLRLKYGYPAWRNVFFWKSNLDILLTFPPPSPLNYPATATQQTSDSSSPPLECLFLKIWFWCFFDLADTQAIK